MVPSEFRVILMDRVRAFDKFAHQDMKENPEVYENPSKEFWEELWREYEDSVQ